MARFWWVNHKQTARDEIAGSFIWSPKTKANGNKNYFYDTMIEALPGDCVLSYANGQISYFGVVLEAAYSEGKPEFMAVGSDAWDHDGWLLPVSWQSLTPAVRPKQLWDQIEHLFPEKYSPLNSKGDGNQGCYLTEISDSLFQKILAFSLEKNSSLFVNAMKAGSWPDSDIFSTHRKTTEVARVVQQRIGQLEFRRAVLELEGACPITGVGNPAFLRASHIKPWRDCKDAQERLDPHNGLALAPHVDVLFDQGYISFDVGGCLILSNACPPTLPVQWAFEGKIGVELIKVGNRRRKFLKHHHQHVFKR